MVWVTVFFGFLGSFYEKDCYLGVALESQTTNLNHQESSHFEPEVMEVDGPDDFPDFKCTRWDPLTTNYYKWIYPYTYLQSWLNRVCWGYNYLLTRAAPSCRWFFRVFSLNLIPKTPYDICTPPENKKKNFKRPLKNDSHRENGGTLWDGYSNHQPLIYTMIFGRYFSLWNPWVPGRLSLTEAWRAATSRRQA